MNPQMLSVRELLFQAFLTGWQQRGCTIPQDEYLESCINVIEMLQVEPEFLYVEEGLGLLDGDEVDHLEDLVRADGVWLYYGVEAENFFLLHWYPTAQQAQEKLDALAAEGEGLAYLVDLTLERINPSCIEKFGNASPNQLRS